jgi:hypothetical protein
MTNAFTIPARSIFTSKAELERQTRSESGKKAGRIRHQQERGTVYQSKAALKRSA